MYTQSYLKLKYTNIFPNSLQNRPDLHISLSDGGDIAKFLFRSLSLYLNVRYYHCTRRNYYRFCLILSNVRYGFKNKCFHSIAIPYVVFSKFLFEGNPTCSKIEISSIFKYMRCIALRSIIFFTPYLEFIYCDTSVEISTSFESQFNAFDSFHFVQGKG